MPKFHRWPLFDQLVLKYFDDATGWRNVTEWDAEDIVSLELFANAELQRRASAQGARTYVPGSRTIN